MVIDMQMHALRKNQDELCPVCDAAPRHRCQIGTGPEEVIDLSQPVKRDQQMQPALDVEWLEFQLLACVNNLRQVKPNHYLVKVIEAALTPNYEGETPRNGDLFDDCALLKKQAE